MPSSTRTIRLASAVILAADLALGLGCASDRHPPMLGGGEDDPACPGCNVVLIMLPGLRKDHLGIYGYSRRTSPQIDNFFASGWVFDQVQAPAAWTLPAAASLLTSLFPYTHGVMDLQGVSRLADEFWTMPEILREHGYQTAAFVGGGEWRRGFNLRQGFDTYVEAEDTTMAPGLKGSRVGSAAGAIKKVEWGPDQTGLDPRAASLGWESIDLTERPQSANASRRSVFGSLKRPLVQAIDWLQQRRAQPFFLLLQGHDLRCPYQPSPPFDRQFDPDYQGTGDFSSCFWADGGSHPVLHGSTYAWPVWIASGQGEARRVFLSRRDLDHWIALYDGALLEADLGLANFFAAVAGLGLMERTLFVLMSEHGAMLGEHGSFSDQGPLCTSLFQPVLNVPLLVRHPRRTAIKSVSALVQTVDLLPTLVEMLGVADRSASLRQGRSLVPALRHPGTEVNPHAFAGTRSLSCRNSRYSGAAVAEAVRTPTWKMTREALYDPTTGERLGSSHRLYHLVFDPEERNDVLTEHRAVADQLERQLRAFFGPDPLVRQVPICED